VNASVIVRSDVVELFACHGPECASQFCAVSAPLYGFQTFS